MLAGPQLAICMPAGRMPLRARRRFGYIRSGPRTNLNDLPSVRVRDVLDIELVRPAVFPVGAVHSRAAFEERDQVLGMNRSAIAAGPERFTVGLALQLRFPPDRGSINEN